MVTYGVCVGSWERLTAYVTPRVGARALVAMWGQTSIAQAYNKILAITAGPLILQHDDLEITDPDGEAKLLDALTGDVALAGVAGGGGAGLAWWDQNPVGHQRTDVMDVDFGARAGEVELLEGSVLALSAWAVTHLRFDPRFPGFHGYDEIAAQARAAGRRVVVVDVDTHHHTPMGFRSEASHGDWLRSDQLYRDKWRAG